jgi:hypothetical protein
MSQPGVGSAEGGYATSTSAPSSHEGLDPRPRFEEPAPELGPEPPVRERRRLVIQQNVQEAIRGRWSLWSTAFGDGSPGSGRGLSRLLVVQRLAPVSGITLTWP